MLGFSIEHEEVQVHRFKKNFYFSISIQNLFMIVEHIFRAVLIGLTSYDFVENYVFENYLDKFLIQILPSVNYTSK